MRILAAIVALFIALFAWLAITAPLSKSLEPIAAPQITLLAADGTPIARNGAITDEPVEVAALPPHVIHAFLATEDRRFYSHWGVDPRGIARAALTGTGGGSTITQQLAKFTFLTPDRTLTRPGPRLSAVCSRVREPQAQANATADARPSFPSCPGTPKRMARTPSHAAARK